jgi:hypothetical protein
MNDLEYQSVLSDLYVLHGIQPNTLFNVRTKRIQTVSWWTSLHRTVQRFMRRDSGRKETLQFVRETVLRALEFLRELKKTHDELQFSTLYTALTNGRQGIVNLATTYGQLYDQDIDTTGGFVSIVQCLDIDLAKLKETDQ